MLSFLPYKFANFIELNICEDQIKIEENEVIHVCHVSYRSTKNLCYSDLLFYIRKVQEMQNLSKYFFSIICIWLDRACKTVQENIIQNVF